MNTRPGKITAKTVETIKVVRIELEIVPAEFAMGQPVKVYLYSTKYKYANADERNEDAGDSFLNEATGCSGFEGIVDSRPREYEEEWHHPEVKGLLKNG